MAEGVWDGFQAVEIRGEPVTPGDDVADTYAADELEEALDEDE